MIADSGSHRVLIYNFFPLNSGTNANVVVGQTGFTTNGSNANGTTVVANGLSFLNNQSHVGIFSDGTKLYVPDTANNRVLIWNTIPTTSGSNASVVVGQPNLTTNTANNKRSTSPATDLADNASLNQPTAVFVDPTNGKMFIVDSGNHRILVFNSVPTSNHAQANNVVGQTNFKTIAANHGGQLNTNGSQSFNTPTGLWITSNYLLVADSGNNRVLVFNSKVSGNDPGALSVIGQTSFTAIASGSTQATLNNPVSVSSNGSTNNVIVADKGNNRVLLYNVIPTTAVAAGPNASVVLGQTNFTNNQANQAKIPANNTLNSPGGVYLNPSHLLIADSVNNRILRFEDR